MISRLFNIAKLRAHINRAAKKDFFYNHEQKILCDGHTLINVKYEAAELLRERILDVDRTLVVRGGTLSKQACPDFNAVIPKVMVEAEKTHFVITAPHRSTDNGRERIFKDVDGRKTSVREVYSELCTEQIKWFVEKVEGSENEAGCKKVVGKFGDEWVIVILPIRRDTKTMEL